MRSHIGNLGSRDFELTVVIPTYNRSEILRKCLAALESQTVPVDTCEILVSDDGSEDGTREMIEAMLPSCRGNLRYLRQENKGQNSARNRAIEIARGRLLLFINDDTIASPSLIEQHLLWHQKHPEEHVAILGRVTISPEVPPSIFAKLHLDHAFAQLDGGREPDWRAFFTCNVSVKKTFLLKCDLFEESLRYNDDIELAERLSHHGLRIVYNRGCLGYHYHHLSQDDYMRLARLSGRSLAVWYKKSPHLSAELATVGFYKSAPVAKRLQYLLADLAINGRTRPLLLSAAARLSESREHLSLFLYRKIYKSLERESIRDELRRGSAT